MRPFVVEQHADSYLAYFPALIGCPTWGDTFEAAVKHAEEALAVYLDILIAHRDTIPTDGEGPDHRVLCLPGCRVCERSKFSLRSKSWGLRLSDRNERDAMWRKIGAQGRN